MSQVACAYRYSFDTSSPFTFLPESNPTITLASGAEQPGNPDWISPTDEDFFPQQEIGFPFQFNLQTYSRIGVATNGWIWFGNTNPVKVAGVIIPFTNILTADTEIEGIISALNNDLEGRYTGETATIRTRLDGIAPNRKFTIEWRNFKALDDAEGTGYCGDARNRFDIQITLEENSNAIRFSYNTAAYCWQGYSQLFQTGFRGSNARDVHARQVLPEGNTSWSNSSQGSSLSTVAFRSTSPITFPPANAQFIFTPGTPETSSWIGINNDWFNPSNWSNNAVPGRCNDVLIPSGKSHYPELSGNKGAFCKNLTIAQGAGLSIQQNYTSFLTCYGNLINEGSIVNNSSSYLSLAGNESNYFGGLGDYSTCDLFITANAHYKLSNDVILRNLFINEGASLSLENQLLNVFAIVQHGHLYQQNGILVLEGDPSAVVLTDSTFHAGNGTTFFGNGEIWTPFTNQTIPSIAYHNLWIRTNKGHTVEIGTNAEVTCHNLMFYNPGEPGGKAKTTRNVIVAGNLSMGIDSLPGTELELSYRVVRPDGTGIFRMGGNDEIIISHSGNETAIAGFGAPEFKGTVSYVSEQQQQVIRGSYNHLNIRGNGQRQANGKIQLKGILALQGGQFNTADSLILVSDSLGTGLISGQGNGTIQGQVESERYMTGVGPQWALIAPLMEDQKAGDFGASLPLIGPDGSLWDANPTSTLWNFSSDNQSNFQAGWSSTINSSFNLLKGSGYLAQTTGNQVLRVKGLVFSGNLAVKLNPGATESQQLGWNLIGNPYPSPINLNKVYTTNSNHILPSFSALAKGNRYSGRYAVWLRLNENEGIGINGASRYVASQEAFFTKAIANDSLRFNNNQRADIVKIVPETGNTLFPYIRFSLFQNEQADEALIYFKPNTSPGYSPLSDALKPPVMGGQFAMYTLKGDEKLAIHSRKELLQTDTIPLATESVSAGIFQFRLSEFHKIPATTIIWLEDRQNGTLVNLKQNPQTQVTLPEGVHSGRYYLILTPGILASSFRESCEGGDGRVRLQNNGSNAWDVSIFNETDEFMGQKPALTGTHEFLNLPAGEYRIHYELNDGVSMQIDEWIQVDEGFMIDAIMSVSETEVKEPNQTLVFTCTSEHAESWYWNMGDGQMLSGSSVIEHIYEEPGLYTTILTVTRNECSDTASINIYVLDVTSTGNLEVDLSPQAGLYPNPARTESYLDLKNKEPLKDIELAIVDRSGKLVFSKLYGYISPGEQLHLELNNLSAGTYEIVLNGIEYRSNARLVVIR
jgi:hypothetical protein